MSFEADAIIERRRLRRNLTLWRITAIIGLAAAFAIVAASLARHDTGARSCVHAGNIWVSLLATRNGIRRSLILPKTAHAKALIVTIDSPGGTTSGSEGLYLALREVARKKPVVAVMGTVAASGGYITAIGADHIIARGNTITGSIGVLMQNTEVSELMKKIGVGIELITSGPLKGKPSPFEPMDAQGRAAIRTLIDDLYQWFVGLVAERRNLTPERAQELADGRVYSGRLALEAKLIDQIGGMPEARAWLEKEKDISGELPLEPLVYGDDATLSRPADQ